MMRMVLLILLSLPVSAGDKPPLLVVLDAQNPAMWEQLAQKRSWRYIRNSVPANDAGMLALRTQVKEAVASLGADPARVYLAGQGNGTPAVLLAASRLADLWTAAVAIEGTIRPAVNSNRLFGANTQDVPVLWYTNSSDPEQLRQKLAAQNFNLTVKAPEGLTPDQVLDWLAEQHRDLDPAAVDCETGSTAFASCYWLQLTGFDLSKRNDVLGSSRVNAGSAAYLGLGGFGYDSNAPGPGVEVAWLPPNYKGPLELHDRIVSVAGKPIANASEYIALMDQASEEKAAAVVIERGKERKRIETKIVVPKREETSTVRVQGSWLVADKEVQIISRGVSQLRLTLPVSWAPVAINWNGSDLGKAEQGGCWDLSIAADPPTAKRCP